MGSTKVVKYRDDDGKLKQSIIPITADESEARLGIEVALSFPESYEPMREQLEAALAARGIVTPDDLFKPGADDLIRQAIWQVTRLDIQTIKNLNKK